MSKRAGATAAPLDPAAVSDELERIAESRSFRKAERCLRLLRHITSLALEGRGAELKEYALGVTVFQRPDSYDPRTDPIVRLEARRLRLKLAEYYQQEGLDDQVVIELPKGAYVPDFRLRRAVAPAALDTVAAARSKHPLLWAVVAAGVLGFSWAAWYGLQKRAERPVVRASVAVLGFRDLGSGAETSWIAPAVTELMNVELGVGQLLRTLPLENVTRMRTELSVTPQATYPAQLLQRIRTNLGIDYAVAGAYLPQNHRIRLDVALFDVRSGQQIAAVSDDAEQDKLSELASGCASRIRAHLGVRLSSLDGGTRYSAVEPAAMEAYGKGIERLRQSDALSARPYLENAAASSPANPLIHSALAATWSMMGLDARAQQEAKLAFDSSAGLGRVEQLEIEGRYRNIAHEWARAIQVYQALFTLLPDDLEYGLLLASAESLGGKAQDALGTVNTLRNLPSPLRDDPRIDLAEARAAGAISDFARTRKAAHEAAEKALQHGARLQYARARLLESGAMQTLGAAGYAEVRAEARRICAELGDRASVAAAYRIEANSLAATNAPAAARPLYAAALQIANEIGNSLEKLNARMGLAYIEKLQGDLKSAEADDRAALAEASEMGPQKSYAVCLHLAEVLMAEGRIAEARTLSEHALEASRQIHEREGIALSEAEVAHLSALEGKSAEAVAWYNEAIAVLREVNEPSALFAALLDLGDVQTEEGNPAGARKSYEEARTVAQRVGGFVWPEIDLAFARLNLAGGQALVAATHAQKAMDAFTAAGRQGDRLAAAAVLVRALIASGNVDQATEVIGQIPLPDGKRLPVWAVLQFRMARCLVLANNGRRAEAVRAMDAITAEVARLRVAPFEKETRLARQAVAKAANDSGHRRDLSHSAFAH